MQITTTENRPQLLSDDQKPSNPEKMQIKTTETLNCRMSE